MRAYFFDMDAPKGERELKDCPANGAEWTGTDSMAVDANGQFVKDTNRAIHIKSPRCIAAGFGNRMDRGVRNEVEITADHFPGKRIRVKIWAPARTEWTTLQNDSPDYDPDGGAPHDIDDDLRAQSAVELDGEERIGPEPGTYADLFPIEPSF
jgi:hypothetical protein